MSENIIKMVKEVKKERIQRKINNLERMLSKKLPKDLEIITKEWIEELKEDLKIL